MKRIKNWSVAWFIITVSIGFLSAQNHKVSLQAAEFTLLNFLENQKIDPQYKYVEYVRTADDKLLFYVFHLNKGTVAVSAIPHTRKILCYAPDADLMSAPPQHPLFMWIEAYKETLAKTEVAGEEHVPFKDSECRTQSGNLSSVPLLLHSHWGQGSAYNVFTPYDSESVENQHCLVGCVATAMSQIMHFHRYPTYGIGSTSYDHPDYGCISASFSDQPYEWEKMSGVKGAINPTTAHLMKDCGVSVNMSYGPSGSGAFGEKAADALRDYFKYSSNLNYELKDDYQGDWDAMLKNNLDFRHPLFYTGSSTQSGHAFVCDGYMEVEPNDYLFHFDWGWDGYMNAYVVTDPLQASSEHDYNLYQSAISDLYPDSIQETQWTSRPRFQNKMLISKEGSCLYYPDNSVVSAGVNQTRIAIAPDVDTLQQIHLYFTQQPDLKTGDSIVIQKQYGDSTHIYYAFGSSWFPNAYQDYIVETGSFDIIYTHRGGLAKPLAISYIAQSPCLCSEVSYKLQKQDSIADGPEEKNYADNVKCRWNIEPVEPGISSITIRFSKFDLETDKDYLYLLNRRGDTLERWTGNELPETKTYEYPKLKLVFQTDYERVEKGFKLHYIANNQAGLEEMISEEIPLTIYPTICQREFMLAGTLKTPATLRIYDLKGSLYREETLSAEAFHEPLSYDVENLPSGTSLIQCCTQGKTYLFRLIKP